MGSKKLSFHGHFKSVANDACTVCSLFCQKNKSDIPKHHFFPLFLQNLNIETTLEAGNGRHVEALEIFTFTIHYLHKRALEVIQERTGDEHLRSGDIQWVLTVPAIWKQAAKQFMRAAAYQVKYSLKYLSGRQWKGKLKREFVYNNFICVKNL